MYPSNRLQRTPIYQKNFFQEINNDEQAMELALQLAQLGAYWQEVPVGAIVLDGQNRVIGMGVNQTLYGHDPTQHAEIVALRDASKFMGNYRLPGSHLYVSLEPCMMCMGALLHARLERVIYGASDPKTGVCHSVLHHEQYAQLNHHTTIEGGLLQEQSATLLRSFFKARREKKR